MNSDDQASISRRQAIGMVALLPLPFSCAVSGCEETDARAAPLGHISVRQLGAIGDGRSDDSRAFQRAHDALPQGGTIDVPAGRYAINTIRITNSNITFRLASDAALIKRGPLTPETRGIFAMDGLEEAQFTLIGGTIDLNGEGPMGIGVPGRIPNRYADQTVAGIRALAGPSNAAVFALRSSKITVKNVIIRNSGESGLLFRNCGEVSVSDSVFENIANYGVEFSLAPASDDGSRGAMPARDRCVVRNCSFTDIDDYGLGTGNGVGVGGGGADRNRHTDYTVEDCRFLRCQRDIHFELAKGLIRRVRISGIVSTEARQGSLGLIGVEDVLVDRYTIRNVGTASNALLGPRPDVYGVVLSTSFSSVRLRNIVIDDDRTARIRRGARATIERGSRSVEAPDAMFSSSDVGAAIGILTANPGGACYVGRIAAVESATRATLDLPAGASARNANYVIGGATRNGIILRAGDDVTLEQIDIRAGADDIVPGAVLGAAILIEGVSGPVTMTSVRVGRSRAQRPARAGIVIQNSSGVSTAGAIVTGYEQSVAR